MERGVQPETSGTVIIGGGQAGLATAYELKRRGRSAVVLEAGERIGDSWRRRWDSLRLFTPAKLSHLPGMKYPAGGWTFASKDEFADYLEGYAAHFGLDVRLRARTHGIERDGDAYLVSAGDRRFTARHVVIATGAYQEPKVPVFAPELDPAVLQMHSSAYRNPGQLRAGPVLVVGAGNSGAEIALELAAGREVFLSGTAPVFPVRPGSLSSRVVMPLFLLAAKHVLTVKTPPGRRLRPRAQQHAAPVLRAKPKDLAAAGVQRVPRVAGVHGGRPVLEDGRALDVANVVWCTGFRSDFSWIDLPAFASGGEPAHDRGVLREEPGVYLIGQRFQYALASSFVAGVGRDAGHIAGVIDRRLRDQARPEHRSAPLADARPGS